MKHEITIGEWLPDLPDFKNPGLTTCQNVYPASAGYEPFLGAIGTGSTVTGTILGAARFDRDDGTRVIVVGTTSDLYVIVGGTVTASSLSLSVPSNENWSFETFGAYVFATIKSGATYYLTDINTDTSFSLSTGAPPSGRSMKRIGDFLVMGNLTDIDATDKPYRIRWSKFNNPVGAWDTDIATQSGFFDMPSQYGAVVGISGGTSGLVFQKYGVNRLTYVGGATAFRREVVDEERGCAATCSIVRVGSLTYWVAYDGFFRTDGSAVQSVSGDKIWDWFVKNSNMPFISQVCGAVDWRRRCVVWAFYGLDRTSYTGLLIYNWEQDRWSHTIADVDALVENNLEGLTLEQVAVLYPDLDAMTLSLDSPEFTTKGRSLSVFTGNELSDLVGPALEAEVATGDFQISPTRRSYVTEVWPIVENQSGNARVAIGARNKPGETIIFGADVAEGAMGYAPVNADGRYFRVRLKIPAAADWGKMSALQLEAMDAGT